MLQQQETRLLLAQRPPSTAARNPGMRDAAANDVAGLLAGLYAPEELAAALVRLAQRAQPVERPARRAVEMHSRRAAIANVFSGTLIVALLTIAFLLGHASAGPADIHRTYRALSPAVADIRVESAGVTGSGVLFDAAGHILTNYHVIRDAQRADDITVRLAGLDRVTVELVGYDAATDLAVLRVADTAGKLRPARFGDPKQVQVGDQVVVIGSPFRLSQTLTVGHISAVGRQLTSLGSDGPAIGGVLQTDAAINPGNSGGPLVNTRGEVVGIVTRMESPSGGSVGLGFAIPSDTALQVAHRIVADRSQRQSAHLVTDRLVAR
jgi:S1-C subfamily serine protease